MRSRFAVRVVLSDKFLQPVVRGDEALLTQQRVNLGVERGGTLPP